MILVYYKMSMASAASAASVDSSAASMDSSAASVDSSMASAATRIHCKLLNYDKEFTIDVISAMTIPFFNKIITSDKYKESEDKCIMIQTYEQEISDKLYILNSSEFYEFVEAYYNYWGKNIENENYLVKNNRQKFEITLISQKVEEFDLKLIYKYINDRISEMSEEDQSRRKTSLLVAIEQNLQILDKLVINAVHIGTKGIVNKVHYTIITMINQTSYLELEEYINRQV